MKWIKIQNKLEWNLKINTKFKWNKYEIKYTKKKEMLESKTNKNKNQMNQNIIINQTIPLHSP